MSELDDFLKYVDEQRKDFSREVIKYTPDYHLRLRTETDSFLIAYDQMRDRIVQLAKKRI